MSVCFYIAKPTVSQTGVSYADDAGDGDGGSDDDDDDDGQLKCHQWN